ncbi:CYFA0S06e04786g1_1 [Cyberlindnera fabianii]|uniref:Putative lipoate-protein ligase A n=1 Tax=Cyberlindnera fabianii TaxID=36022 RepID=A0A061AVN4_CYBFA|nr:CYFA0S06e04786g1_1 [Cyberlindnera fabianii]
MESLLITPTYFTVSPYRGSSLSITLLTMFTRSLICQTAAVTRRVCFRRGITSKSTPFELEPKTKGEDPYADVNSFYSDMFTESPRDTSSGTTPSEVDEISELNQEMADFYGVDNLADPIPTSHDALNQDQMPTPQSTVKPDLLATIQANKPAIFLSSFHNPFKNLALEDYIFTHTPVSSTFLAHRLIFYVNSPCVVIGKNQNPWKEANIPLLKSLQIPLLRRRSGGGTVVHDLRNVNYSYITTRPDFNRSFFGKVIVDAINNANLGVELDQNDRGDIITKLERKKVSGSAFKISKGKSYHHGTMLLDSKLDILRSLLNTKDRDQNVEFRCGSVDSVPSPVTNVGLDNESFMEVVADGFFELYGEDVQVVSVEETDLPQQVLDTADELEQWDWRYGNTPKFEMDITHPEFKITLKVEKGLVKSFTVDQHADKFVYLQQVLESGEKVRFIGSDISGYILDESYGEFIGKHIDGTD